MLKRGDAGAWQDTPPRAKLEMTMHARHMQGDGHFRDSVHSMGATFALQKSCSMQGCSAPGVGTEACMGCMAWNREACLLPLSRTLCTARAPLLNVLPLMRVRMEERGMSGLPVIRSVCARHMFRLSSPGKGTRVI